MLDSLAEALFERKLFVKNMEIEAEFNAPSLGNLHTTPVLGRFLIKTLLRDKENKLLISAASMHDGSIVLIPCSAVFRLDGMTPERFAAVYGIQANGSKRIGYHRRGRKPKIRSAEVIAY